MYIPVTFKNVILSLTDTDLVVYLVCLIPAIFFFGTIYTMIGLGLNNIEEFFEPKEFSDLSTIEKIKIISGYMIIVATIIIMIWICKFTNRKIEEYKRMEEDNEKQEILEDTKVQGEDNSFDIEH